MAAACLPYDVYRDKVFGCWLGKCIGGTVGAPYEGMKQLLDLAWDPALAGQMLPNDDLDLQVLWLHVLEQRGSSLKSMDLAKAFAERVPYAPGEYAVFKKNYARGLRPPYTGSFDNHYYVEGMGCPIRSEIWACVSPGNPELAAALAGMDGILDHAGASVQAEQFLAAAEAMAFVEPDLKQCLERGWEFLPEDTKLDILIDSVFEWCERYSDWRETRRLILRDFGHPDCTHLYQNIGFTLLALLYGGEDVRQTVMTAVNCGFDTDCTAATSAAFLGILQGAKRLENEQGFTDPGYELSIDLERRSDRLEDLAEDTARMGVLFLEANPHVDLEGAPKPRPIPVPSRKAVSLQETFDGPPSLHSDEERLIRLEARNHTSETVAGVVEFDIPSDWEIEHYGETGAARLNSDIEIPPHGEVIWISSVYVPEHIGRLDETNVLTARIAEGGVTLGERSFGVVGARSWAVFGPYWENNVDVPPLQPGEGYFNHVVQGAQSEMETLDRIRDYHVNAFADFGRDYLDIETVRAAARGERDDPPFDLFEKAGDRFALSEVLGWEGPSVFYMASRFLCPEDRSVYCQIGHSDAFRIWVNGEEQAGRDAFGWWTNENVHVGGVELRQGENDVVLKLARRSVEGYFSLAFSKGGTCAEHYTDFTYLMPGSRGGEAS